MDRVIIAVALTSFALGQYEIASKLELLAALTLAFLASAVMPAASKLSATEAGRGPLTTMFLEGTKYTLVIAIPITVALMVWADALIRTWVGRGSSRASATRGFSSCGCSSPRPTRWG